MDQKDWFLGVQDTTESRIESVKNLTVFLAVFSAVVISFLVYFEFTIPYHPAWYILTIVLGGAILYRFIRRKNFNRYGVLLTLFVLLFILSRYSDRTDTSAKGHILNHVSTERKGNPLTIDGVVLFERDIRQGKINLVIKPEKVYVHEKESGARKKWGRKKEEKKVLKDFSKVSKGYILVSLLPEVGKLYDQIDFGDRIRVKGVLEQPAGAVNPESFNYKTFLKNQGVYATLRVKGESDIQRTGSGEVYLIEKDLLFVDDIVNRFYKELFAFSKFIKSRFLDVIKKTVPYPESAFLGGVQLGLREGLSQDIQSQFRAAGVSHVLAVSGLHVTIITVMLVILCTIFKIPRKYYVPLIVFFLLVFTVITGMRPSTQRAALMNSLGLISLMLADIFAGKEMPMGYSLTFGVSVATILLLIMNPLLIFEPGFTLSFGAIISLAVITNPLDEFLSKYLSGKNFLAVFPLFISGYFLMALFYPQFLAKYWPFLFPALLVLVYFTRERKFNFFSYGFKDLHPFVASFISAQGAILFGMMFPLSSYYFYQVSLSSPFANFLAIPLIGVIVQLGMLAGIIAFIPFIGIYVALALNAANFLLIKLFLFIAYLFSLMPFPFSPRLPLKYYFLYALMVFLFCFWIPVKKIFSDLVIRYKLNYNHFRRKAAGVAGVIFIGLIASIVWVKYYRIVPEYNITFISDKVSQCAILNFPGVNTLPILINAGDKNTLYKELTSEDIVYDSGERTSSKVILGTGKSGVKAIVFTSMKKENCGGAAFLMKNFQVEKIYLHEKFRDFKGTTFETFISDFYEKDLLWDEQELILTYKYINEVLYTAQETGVETVFVDTEMKVELNGVEITLVPILAEDESQNLITDNSLLVSAGEKDRKIIFTGDSKRIHHEWIDPGSLVVLGRSGDIQILEEEINVLKKKNISRVILQSGFKNPDFAKEVETLIMTLTENSFQVNDTLSSGASITLDYFRDKGYVIRQ